MITERSNEVSISKLQWSIIFFKLNGLFPCAVKASPEIWFSLSRICIIYHIFLCGILTYTNFCHEIPERLEGSSSTALPMKMILEIAQLAIATFIAITIWILYCFNQNKISIIANQFVRADAMLKSSYPNYEFQHPWNEYFVLISIYLTFWAVLTFTEVILSPAIDAWYTKICLYIVPSFTITSFILQYTFAVNLTQKRLKAVNGLMLNHIQNDVEDEAGIEEMIMHYHIVMNDFENWKRIHDELYALVIMISDFFSFLILLVLGYTCFTIIFNSFYLIVTLNGTDLKALLILAANSVSWIVMLFISPAILIRQIASVNTELQRKGAICHKLLNQFRRNGMFREQIEMYSLELLHEKCNFTAFGFFPLNETFLHSVIATTVTYLVIILQFQASNH